MSSSIEPVRVHIASSDVHQGGTPRRPKKRATYHTVTLQAADQAQDILPASGKRKVAFIIALDQAIIIGGNQSNVANGAGTIVPQNVAWPVDDDGPVYAAPSPVLTGTSTARVSVQATYEED